MNRAIVTTTLFIALGIPALAQTGNFRGRVRGLDGEPWANATVVLRSRLPGSYGVRKTMKTDARGRFTAELELAHPYSVFAHTEPSNGRYRVTRVVAPVVASGRRLLIEQQERQLIRVRFRGLDAWKGRKLRFFGPYEIKPDSNGHLIIPPSADRVSYVSVVNDLGLQIGMFYKFEPDTDGICHLDLPAPSRVRVCVTRHDGTPAVDASLYAWNVTVRKAPIPLDAKGGIDLLLPIRPEGQDFITIDTLRFRVGAPGHSLIQSVGFSSHAVKLESGFGTLAVSLEPGRHWCGRVLIGEDTPAAGATMLQWSNRVIASNGRPNRSIGGRPRVLSTDSKGRFTTAGSDPEFSSRFGVRLSPALLAVLGKSDEFPAFPIAILAFLESGAIAEQIELGDLRLGKLCAVDIEVIRPDGSPAGWANILLAKTNGADSPVRLTANDRGKIRIFLAVADRIGIAAESNAAIVVQDFSVKAKRRLRLQLVEGLYVSGVVKGSNEQPAVGTQVINFGGRMGGMGKLESRLGGRGCITDAQGRFKVRVTQANATVRLMIMHGTPGQPGFVNTSHAVEIEEEPLNDVEIILRQPNNPKRK